MSKEKEEKPSWLHPIKRLKWEGAMQTYKEIQARILPKEIAEEYDIDIPPTWKEQPAQFLLRGLGFGKKKLPEGTGVGLVQSPYADIYSIDKNESIIAFNDNDLHLSSVEDFWKFEELPLNTKDHLEFFKKEIFVPTFNSQYKMELGLAYAFIRHKYTGDMYNIQTTYGKEIKVTGNHSVYKWVFDKKWHNEMKRNRSGKLVDLPVQNLKIGEWIAIPKTLPVVEKDRKNITINFSLKRGKFLQKISKTYEISPDLLWILGFFMAEGCWYYKEKQRKNSKYKEIISNITFYSDKESLNKCREHLNNIGIISGITATTYKLNPNYSYGKFKCKSGSLTLKTREFYTLIYSLLEGKKTEIPNWILQLPKEKLKYFILGYWQGDGNHNSKNKVNTFEIYTKEEKIARAFIYILTRFSIVPSKYISKNHLYSISASGIKNADIKTWDKDNDIQKVHRHQIGDLLLVKVKKITKYPVKDYDVYDFAVKGTENFVAGDCVCAHNTKVYGVNPIADLSLYRKMFRTQPDIQQAVMMQVNLSVGKGFTFSHESQEVIDFCNKIAKEINLQEHMLTMATDCLVYGNSFTEIQWDNSEVENEQMYEYKGEAYTKNELEELNIPLKDAKKAVYKSNDFTGNFVAKRIKKGEGSKRIVALKDLDPLYMRVRRDSFGNCLAPDSIVITNPEPKEISSLTLKDKVLTREGKYKPISSLFKIPFSGDLIKITTFKNTAFPIKTTPEHPLMAISKENFLKMKKGEKPTYEWVSAENLTENDYLLYPIPKDVKDLEEISITIFTHNNGKQIFNLKITPQLLSLFGYFIAEGYCTNSQIMFVFHKKEVEYHKFVAKAFKDIFNLEARIKIHKKTNCATITMNSYGVSKLFKTLFSSGAQNKKIPEWIMYLPPEKQKYLLEAYINGGGTRHKYIPSCKDTQVTVTTVSQTLAFQIRDIMIRCGYFPSMYKRPYYNSKGKVQCFMISFGYKPNRICNGFRDSNYLYMKVKSIEKEKYNGFVYDLKLEDEQDHSFSVNFCISHNCFGYIQWISFPPVLIDTESCIHIKYRPMSWGYESAYGTSILMPIIKNNDLLNQFENDASVWIHSKAVPPLIVKGGTPEKPYSTAQMEALMSTLKTRSAATMIFTKGDVSFEEFKTVASDLNLQWWLDYLLLRRYQSLGIPPVLMGKTERGSKGTAEVLLHDFIARLQVIQEFIADPIEEYIFKPLIKAEFGEDTDNIEIIWHPIIEEDKNMRSQRLIQLLQAGAISVNECRTEMGFTKIADPKYDTLEAKEPATNLKGFPPKKPVELSREIEQSKNPPESHMKLEDLKTKKIQLLKLEEIFREKMLNLTKKTKFDLIDDAKLVKDIKTESLQIAENIVNEHILSSYLLGRLKANEISGKEDNLEFKKEDLKPLAKLKKECLTKFENIIDDMIADKERGVLE